MRKSLEFRRSRYAFASLVVAGGLVAGVACGQGVKTGPTLAPHLVISQTTEDFGDQAIGGETAATTFTVTNNGPNTSGTVGVTVEGTDSDNFINQVADDNCSDGTIAAGASCTVDVTFVPIAPPGPKAAELVVVSNQPADGTPKATLTGNATET